MNKETGGPAFPQPTDSTLSWHGMTLRDYFAAKAMQGWLVETSEGVSVMAVARFSYEMADAMLKAREQ